MRHPRVTITTAAVVAAGAVGGIALAVGGSSNGSGYGAPAGTSSNGSLTRPMSAANSATIHTATDVVQGKSEQILVDSKGLPP